MDVLLGIAIGAILSNTVQSSERISHADQAGGSSGSSGADGSSGSSRAAEEKAAAPNASNQPLSMKANQSIRHSKRCPYYMKHRGRQCKKRVVYGYYCYVHNKYRKGLRIKESTIPDAGRGLYAEKPYKQGQIVSQYRGQKLKKREIDKKYGEQGDFTVCHGNKPNNICVDAAVTSSSNGRYANTTNERNNVELKYKKANKTFRLIATEPISTSREIFTDYGQTYHL